MNITPDLLSEIAASSVSMTPHQAIKALDDVAAAYKGSRHDHNVLTSAIRILKGIVQQHASAMAQLAEQAVADEEMREAEEDEAMGISPKGIPTDSADGVSTAVGS